VVSVAGKRYAVEQIERARLIADTSITVPRDAPAWPAVELTLRDRRRIVLTTTDPRDAWRVLEGLFQVAPRLRIPLPPVPDRGLWAGAASSVPGAGFTPPRAMTQPDAVEAGSAEAVLAGIAHLSLFFAPVLLPLIVLLATRERRLYAARQAKQALVFQGIGTVLVLVMVTIWLAFAVGLITGDGQSSPSATAPTGIIVALGILSATLVVLAIYTILFSIYAAFQTFRGHAFSYPMLGRL